jgi:prophage regulatory protein
MMMLRKKDVCRATGHASQTSLHNMVKAGTLTKPVAIGARAVAWPDYEIAAINAARVAGRSDEQLRTLVDQLHARRAEVAA